MEFTTRLSSPFGVFATENFSTGHVPSSCGVATNRSPLGFWRFEV
ncbi:MAG: hypothetical protein ABEJ42_06585 [Halobacteriaceae archaeon]